MTATVPHAPLRILLVSEDVPGWGGLAKHVLMLARMLLAAGHSVSVMGSAELPWERVTDRLPDTIPFLPVLRGHKIGWKEQALGVFNPLRRTVCARRFAAAIVRHAGNFDVVHYHGHLPNIGAFMPRSINFVQTRHDQGSDCLTHLRFRNGAPCSVTDPATCASCATPHPNLVQQVISRIAVARYRREVAAAFSHTRTIFVSRFLRERAERTLGQSANNTVVHNHVDGVSLAMLLANDNEDAPREFSRRYVLLASMLTPYKGVPAFLEAFGARTPPGFDIVIAGGGELEEDLRRQYDQPWIHFVGWVDGARVMRLMRHAEGVIVSSILEEAFCYTALEGLASGAPVFALRRGGIPELSGYERVPGQLRLFDDMASLAAAVRTFEPCQSSMQLRQFEATGARALAKLLAVYQAGIAKGGK